MDSAAVRELWATARVARLATVDAAGRPHLVPVVFALDGDRIHSAVDDKPKRTRQLARLANIAANPQVCLLADHYDEDWTRLWWVRADGRARVLAPGSSGHERSIALLVRRYEQYAQRAPSGAAIVISVQRWTGWSAAPDGGGGRAIRG